MQQGCGMLILFILFLCVRMTSRPLFPLTALAVRTISSRNKASVYILVGRFRVSSLFDARTAAARREVVACLAIEGKHSAGRLELIRGLTKCIPKLRHRVMCYTGCLGGMCWSQLKSSVTVYCLAAE